MQQQYVKDFYVYMQLVADPEFYREGTSIIYTEKKLQREAVRKALKKLQ